MRRELCVVSSLSSWDAARIRDWEDRINDPDYGYSDRDDIDENEMWLRADDEAEERFAERMLHGRND